MISSGEEHRPVENQTHEPTSTEETKLIVADQTVSSEIGGMLGDGFPAVDDLVHRSRVDGARLSGHPHVIGASMCPEDHEPRPFTTKAIDS